MVLWEMILGIVIVVSIAGVVNNYFRARGRQSPAEGEEFKKRVEDIEDYVKNKLEARISNLETILTDKEFELNRKISEL